MPIYEYHCDECDRDFEKLVLSKSDERTECPHCSGNNVTKLMSTSNCRPNGIPSGAGGFDAPSCSPAGGG